MAYTIINHLTKMRVMGIKSWGIWFYWMKLERAFNHQNLQCKTSFSPHSWSSQSYRSMVVSHHLQLRKLVLNKSITTWLDLWMALMKSLLKTIPPLIMVILLKKAKSHNHLIKIRRPRMKETWKSGALIVDLYFYHLI